MKMIPVIISLLAVTTTGCPDISGFNRLMTARQWKSQRHPSPPQALPQPVPEHHPCAAVLYQLLREVRELRRLILQRPCGPRATLRNAVALQSFIQRNLPDLGPLRAQLIGLANELGRAFSEIHLLRLELKRLHRNDWRAAQARRQIRGSMVKLARITVKTTRILSGYLNARGLDASGDAPTSGLSQANCRKDS